MVEIFRDIPSPQISFFGSGVVELRLHSPIKLPFGSFSSRPSGIVEVGIKTSSGVFNGYGEGATLPKTLFTDDSAETIAKSGAFLLENLRSIHPLSLSETLSAIQNIEFPNGERFPTARMMVEMAIIDAHAKSVGKSVRDLLGIPDEVKSIPYGKSLGEGTVQEIIGQAREALESGAAKIKLKISPSSHAEVVKAIDLLKSIGEFEIMVDANGSFDPENTGHVNILKDIDQLGLLMIEEPVSRVGNLKGIKAIDKLRQLVDFRTPICLDDCLIDFETTLLAIKNGYADIVNIKPGRIGSIVRSIELNSYCREKGVQVMVGGMLEATPGRCMTVTLSALFHSLGSKIPGDLSLPQERLSQDLVTDDHLLKYNSKGEVEIPEGPGWGFGEIIIFG